MIRHMEYTICLLSRIKVQWSRDNAVRPRKSYVFAKTNKMRRRQNVRNAFCLLDNLL